ncbi:MAG: hypothetical protein ACKV2O_13540 [Acidimicrobiales bacterium]
MLPAPRGRHLRSHPAVSGSARPRLVVLTVALAVLVGAMGVGGFDALAFGPRSSTRLMLGAGPGVDGLAIVGGSGAVGTAPRVGPTAVGPDSAGPDSTGTDSNDTTGTDIDAHRVDPSQPDPAGPAADGDRAPRSSQAVASVGLQPPCEVVPAARSLGLSSYYEKACVVQGVPVVASAAVSDPALVAAAEVLAGMLRNRPDLVAELIARRFRLGIIGVGQRAIELPEYRDLPVSYPQTDWDAARAYGATPTRPLAAVPEENLLCLPDDTYPGQSVLAHELGHSVLDMAVLPNNPAFEDRIRGAFRAAVDNPFYRNTYAMTNVDEYWGEGVQDFFDASREAHGPGGGGDGYDGPIFSRDTLRRHDPMLHALIAEVFTEVPWRPTCP